jgi:diketogulonate reductase-like aldo/keto reductase
MENRFYTLSNQLTIPAIGFGTWQIPQGEIAYNSVLAALKAGYRHLDTAMAYGNEESVGKAIKDSKIKREDIFVTTKLPAEIKGYQQALDAFNKSLKALDLERIDLYLIHAPKPWGKSGSGMEYMDQNIESWKAFEKLYQEGKIRSIGVSNFLPMHLEKLMGATSIVPMVNQILINPGTIPHDNISFCREHNILLEAYSPLATGRIFELKYLEEIAERYQKTVAQLCIRWSFQNGFLPLPKSQTETRIIENLKIFDFVIEPEDMNRIGQI